MMGEQERTRIVAEYEAMEDKPAFTPWQVATSEALGDGATPGPEEFDNREIWNEEEALAGIEEAIHILAGAVAPDGTQLADERESLLWGFVNTLHAQVQRLDRRGWMLGDGTGCGKGRVAGKEGCRVHLPLQQAVLPVQRLPLIARHRGRHLCSNLCRALLGRVAAPYM